MGVFGEASKLAIAGFFVTIVSFVLQLIGFATPFWSYADVNGVSYSSGLWEFCVSGTCSSFVCNESSSYGCTSGWKAAGALEVIAFLSMLVAVVLLILKMFFMKDKPPLRIAAIVCCFIGGATALVGVIIYASEDLVDVSVLHFSFAFCIIAFLGSFVAAVLLIVGK